MIFAHTFLSLHKFIFGKRKAWEQKIWLELLLSLQHAKLLFANDNVLKDRIKIRDLNLYLFIYELILLPFFANT